MLSFLCVLLLSFVVPSFSELADVDNFVVTVASGDTSMSTGTVYFTLWWNQTIYQSSITAPSVSSVYTATSSGSAAYTIASSSACNPPQYKMRVELNIGDAVIIDKLQVNLKDNNWFGVDSFCTPYRYGDGASSWTVNTGTCTTPYHYDRFCVDNEINDCGPYRQMIYFDSNQPNQWHTTSLIEDGTSSSITTTTCDPTQSPSSDPTRNPSKTPSASPTRTPTSSPTNTPSEPPTDSPLSPSSSPTLPPTTTTTTTTTDPPSKHLSVPNESGAPTLSPNEVTSSTVTESTMDADDGKMEESAKKTDSTTIYVIIICVAGAVCLVLMLFAGYKLIGDLEPKRKETMNDAVLDTEPDSPNATQTDIEMGSNSPAAVHQPVVLDRHTMDNGLLNEDNAVQDDHDDGDEELYQPQPDIQRVVTPTSQAADVPASAGTIDQNTPLEEDTEDMYSRPSTVTRTATATD